VLSAGNRELRVNAEKAPGSLDELARITPKVMHDRVELDLPLALSRKAS